MSGFYQAQLRLETISKEIESYEAILAKKNLGSVAELCYFNFMHFLEVMCIIWIQFTTKTIFFILVIQNILFLVTPTFDMLGPIKGVRQTFLEFYLFKHQVERDQMLEKYPNIQNSASPVSDGESEETRLPTEQKITSAQVAFPTLIHIQQNSIIFLIYF